MVVQCYLTVKLNSKSWISSKTKPAAISLWSPAGAGSERLPYLSNGKQAEAPAIYWVASRVLATQLLRSFSQAVYNYQHADLPANANFSYPTWVMSAAIITRTATSSL